MKFITKNDYKFVEMRTFLPGLEQVPIDLPEIQEIDTKKIITAKLQEASKHVPVGTEIIVEDTSLFFHEMNKLPGPFIKWFLGSIGLDGIWNIAKNFTNKGATATTIIGYMDTDSNIHFFQGNVEGVIVEPRGVGFGWNPIFQVAGTDKNFTEMNDQEKIEFSMRAKAVRKLSEYLSKV